MSDVAAPAPASDSGNPDTGENAPEEGAATLSGSAPVAKTAPGAAAEERRLRLKLKVDGAEEDWEGSEADVARELQLSRAARKRMQEAAEYRKQATEFMERVRKDPVSALKDPSIGVDVKELVKKQLIKEYEDEQLKAQDPREFELREAKAKLEAYEQERKQAEEAWHKEQERLKQEELDTKVRGQLEQQFIAAMEKSNLPKNAYGLAEMAKVAQISFAKGLDLTPDEMAREAEERMDGNAKRYLGALKGEQLVAKLGPDVVKEVQRYLLAKARGAKAAPPVVETKPVVAPVNREPERPKRMNQAEMQKLFRQGVK